MLSAFRQRRPRQCYAGFLIWSIRGRLPVVRLFLIADNDLIVDDAIAARATRAQVLPSGPSARLKSSRVVHTLDGGMIVVLVLAVLSPILGSFSCPVTVAVLVIVPAGVAGSTVTVMVTVRTGAICQIAQSTRDHTTCFHTAWAGGCCRVKGHANWQRISNGYSSSIGWTIVGHGQGVCQIATRCYWIR